MAGSNAVMTAGGGPTPEALITVPDIVGLAFAVFGLLWSAAAAIQIQPHFKAMFADFGQQLPLFTELCLKPWFPLALGLVPLIVVGEGIARRLTRRDRVLRTGLAIFLTLALPGVFLIGMYLPIFSIASAVK